MKDEIIDYIAQQVLYAVSVAVGAAVMHATIEAREKVDGVALAAGATTSIATYCLGLWAKSKLLK